MQAGGFLAASEAGPAVDTVRCFADGINGLVEDGNDPHAPGEIANATAEFGDFGDALETVADNLENGLFVAGVLPGIIVIMTVVLMACGRAMKFNNCCFTMSKIFVLIAVFASIGSLITFIIIAAVGFGAGTPQAEAEWDAEAVTTCANMSSDFTTMLANAQQAGQYCDPLHFSYNPTVCGNVMGPAYPMCDPSNALYSGSGCSYQANQVLHVSESAVEFFQSMCVCISNTLDSFTPFFVPGIVGAAGSAMAFFFLLCFCCSMSCCRKIEAPDAQPSIKV